MARTVPNHRLTRFDAKLDAIELYPDDVRFKRYQIRDAAHLGVGLGIRPCRQLCVTDIAVAA
jgi:hypothetical protein